MLGLFAGVVGYYLFGTKQGEKSRRKIAFEWEKAQDHLVEQGVLGDGDKFKNLNEIIQKFKDELLKKLEIEPIEEPKKTKSPRKKRTYQRKKKQKQFKGV